MVSRGRPALLPMHMVAEEKGLVAWICSVRRTTEPTMSPTAAALSPGSILEAQDNLGACSISRL